MRAPRAATGTLSAPCSPTVNVDVGIARRRQDVDELVAGREAGLHVASRPSAPATSPTACASLVLMTTSTLCAPSVRSNATMPASSSIAVCVVDVRHGHRAAPERRVGLANLDELLDPLERAAVGAEAGVPQPLAIGRIVAAVELLLGAVIDAGDAVFGEQERERVLQRRRRRLVEEEARDVVVVHEVDERVARRHADAVVVRRRCVVHLLCARTDRRSPASRRRS